MGTLGSARHDPSAGRPARTASAGSGAAARPRFTQKLIRAVEFAAPFAAGGLLLGSGVTAAAASLGFRISTAGPLQDAPFPACLMVAGAGAGIIMAAWDSARARRHAAHARKELSKVQAQRDNALTQARRMRMQAEGLALMREIHRSTAIPVRRERLQRILTLLADLFEAREVSLFAVNSSPLNGGTDKNVQIAASLRITDKEEFFADFDADSPSGAGILRVAKNGANIEREGCHLLVEGILERDGVPVARAQWRRGAKADEDLILEREPADLLSSALAKIDLSQNAFAFALQSLQDRRTLKIEQHASVSPRKVARDIVALCVPLIADQKAVGVLRIKRSTENGSFDAEALEEMLLESAKHIALALKKDDDDRKAITDGLTGLYIKRHFLAVLDQLCAKAEAGGGFCLVMSDIDHFKKVNDTHGHLSGDYVLKGVAAVLHKGLRAGDIAFRYGGEEMAVLLPNTDVTTGEAAGERLRLAVQAAVLKGEKGQVIPVTVSMGIVAYEPGFSGEDLISRADKALYASKQGGRNRVTRYKEELVESGAGH